MRKRTGIIAGAVLATVMLLAPTAAHAVVSKTGTVWCSGTQKTTGYTTGTTEHYPAPSGYVKYYNGTAWLTTTRMANTTGGGFWFVQTTGSISDGGTKATCTNVT